MADPQKRYSSSVNVKEKDPLQDLEIGNDFFSWKSISIAEGDGLDFDLTPVSKGNKKTFNFDKADMDFNLDADFGKMSSFNLDMSDLDISPPLKKDAKSKEKSQESSSGKNKDKPDHFAFGFDFDELDNFSFDSTSRKEGTKAQKDKNNKESFPNGSGYQDKEGSIHIDEIGSKSTLKDGPQKPSLSESRITFDMDLEPTREISPSNLAMDEGVTPEYSAAIDEGASDKVKGSLDTTISREIPNISPSKRLASPGQVDFEVYNKNDVILDLSSDYLPKNEPSGGNSSAVEKRCDSVDTIASGSNKEQDANMTLAADLTCNYKHTISRNSQQHQAVAVSVDIDETGGDNSSAAESMISCMDTNVSSLGGEQDANMILVAGSTSDYEHTSIASQHHQAVAFSENINGERTQDGIKSHVEDDRGRTELSQTNSHVENSCNTGVVSGIPFDTQVNRENQEPFQEILKSSLISQPANPLDKQIENIKEPLCSRPLIQSEKPECPVLKVSTHTLSSKQMGFAQPSLVEGRNGNATQSDRNLSLQCSKTLLRGIIPQIQSQKSCSGLKIYGDALVADGLRNGNKLNDSGTKQVKDMVKTKSAPRQGEVCSTDLDTLRDAPVADGLRNGNKLNDSGTKQVKDMVKTKSAPRQGEMSTKDPDTLSMKTNSKAAENSGNQKMLASLLLNKSTPAQEHITCAIDGGRKPPDLPGLKLSSLSIDSTKSPILRESKSVGNSSQKSVLTSKTQSGIAHLPDKCKQTTSTLSVKRTLEDDTADTSALHPSKRLLPSVATSRNFVETSEKVQDKKAIHNRMEDDRIKSTTRNCPVMPFDIPHEVKTKEVEILSLTKHDSNIILADACSKELDDLCDILRKKHDEAKELLVQAIMNSNKLLMLNNPQFEEKINTQQHSRMKSSTGAVNFLMKVTPH